MVKVHVHSNAPGKILQLALRLGELDKLKIENMREQNREIQAKLKETEKECAMVAVSTGAGIDAVFTELGVEGLIQGGQTMNPSIDTISKAIRRVNARNVFILPNNSNIILAAQQAAELSDRNVIVLPTKTIVQGISAATAYLDGEPVADNEARMRAAAERVISGSVTYAVRDTSFNGTKIEKGNIIGLMGGNIVSVGNNVDEASLALLDKMMENAPEEMNFFNSFVDKGLLDRLHNVASSDFARVTYTEAIEILEKNNDKFDYKVSWGADLQTEHERYLTEEVYKRPVFVTDYPKDIKAFYMKMNDDNKTVAAVDCLVPGIGEIIGGSQREDNYEKLLARMNEMGLKPEEYQFYLDLRKYGSTRHAGFGLGFERCVMYLTGMSNIRDVLPFPRTVNNCEL